MGALRVSLNRASVRPLDWFRWRLGVSSLICFRLFVTDEYEDEGRTRYDEGAKGREDDSEVKGEAGTDEAERNIFFCL